MDKNAEMIGAAAINYTELTTSLVAAYVSNNHVQPGEIAALIVSTHAALTGLGQSAAAEAQPVEKLTLAQIRKSITPDALISFLDGKPYKTMKRHLSTNGMTPDEYRARFRLPRDYPTTAANYSAMRSEFARGSGLGQKRRTAAPKVAELTETIPEKPKRRGRPRKTKEAAKA